MPTALFVAALPGLSLLAPSTPTYDPWAWIVWGREITQLDLATVGGPSWKPLPAIFTTPFALAGDAAPALWLVVARAGGLLALVLTYALARRLGGATAGLVAGGGLLLSLDFGRTVWLGNSEGLLVAALAGGVLLHLEGRDRAALAAAVGAALLRPEVWPFAGLYGAWLLWRRPELRLLVIGSGGLVLALWLLPELWGSGSPLRAAERAQEPNLDSPAFAPDPLLAVLQRAEPVLAEPFRLAALAGAAASAGALLRRPRRRAPHDRGRGRWLGADRRDAVTLALAVAALAWLGLVALMTERGFSGNPRYLIAPTALACVVAGVGAARTVDAAARTLAWRSRIGRPAAAAAIGLLLTAAAAGAIAERAQKLGAAAAELGYQAELRAGLEAAIARFGGPAVVNACGAPHVERFSVPLLAWLLERRLAEVGFVPRPPAVAFRGRAHRGAVPEPDSVAGLAPRFRSARWSVHATCRN